MSPEQRADMARWASCLTGALTREEYLASLTEGGFVDIRIDDSHPVAEGFT